MNLAKLLALLGVIIMTAAIAYGFSAGDFGAEGAILTSLPWGIVSLVDLYVGFTLFSAWIVYREKSILAAILWIVAVMTLGAFATSGYILLNLHHSRGDWQKFFMGQHAS
jgi:hypothetical protein